MNMKKKLTYILPLITLAAALVSCREIEVSVAASGDPISVRAMVTEGPETRGVATGTSLPTSATMYLSADHNGTGTSGNYFSNVAFTASGSTWSPQSGSYYWPLSGNLELLGFCNYGPTDFSSTATRTNATAISVASSDWTDNDMMFGAATGAPASGTTMAFRHALAQVKFTARMTVDGSINLKSITFNGIKGATLSCSKSSGSASLTINSSTSGYSSSTVTAFSGTQALTSTATAAGSPVLMPDQTITSITVTYASVSGGVEGTAETVTKSVSQALTKGYAYTFALTVESQGIKFDISVTPWNTNPINIGEFPYEDPVPTFGGFMISPGPLHYSSANGFELIDDDWNHHSYDGAYGKTNGSYYFNYEELGQYFDSRGTSFPATSQDAEIDNNGNKISYGGYDDWRMPTEEEADIIFDMSSSVARTGATINGVSGCKWAIVDIQDSNIDNKWGTTLGVLLAPDNLTLTSMSKTYAWQANSNNSSNWTTIAEVNEYVDAGCALIPAFGVVSNTGVFSSVDDNGYFVTTNSTDVTNWYGLSFDYANIRSTYNAINKSRYYYVRLVRRVD